METKFGPGAGQEDEPPKSGRSAAPALGTRADVSGQLRFFQVLSGALCVLLVAGLGYMVYRQHKSQPITVLVNGVPVTTVIDYTAASNLIAGLPNAQIGKSYTTGSDPKVVQSIQLRPASSDATIDTDQNALSKLAAVAHVTVLADIISIDGKPFVALPDAATAQAALDAVRAHYASMPPQETIVDKPEFRELVSIERKRVPTSLCLATSDDAVRKLITPPPAKLATVAFGQTGWQIARLHHMTFSDFVRANSGRDLDHLKPGDTVNISATYPALTVIVHKNHSATEAILPGAPASAAGEREVTSIDTYVNGVRTGESTPVSVYTLHRATPRERID